MLRINWDVDQAGILRTSNSMLQTPWRSYGGPCSGSFLREHYMPPIWGHVFRRMLAMQLWTAPIIINSVNRGAACGPAGCVIDCLSIPIIGTAMGHVENAFGEACCGLYV